MHTSAVLPPANINDILAQIPHRYPFVLIDRVIACERGKWVRVIKNVTNDEWFFRERPLAARVMPPLLIVEALAQSSGTLIHHSGMAEKFTKPIIFFAGIEECRFARPVRPGDQLLLECRLLRHVRDVVKVSGCASVDGETVVELKLTAAIRERDSNAQSVSAKPGQTAP